MRGSGVRFPLPAYQSMIYERSISLKSTFFYFSVVTEWSRTYHECIASTSRSFGACGHCVVTQLRDGMSVQVADVKRISALILLTSARHRRTIASMLKAITASRICTVTAPVTGELVTGVEDEIAAFLEFSRGMEAYESDVLAGDDDASRVLAPRQTWTATPPVTRWNADGWRGVSRVTALRKAIASMARVTAAALAAIAAALATLVTAIVGAICGADTRPSTHPPGRLHRLPHAALTPRLAARPRGGRVLIAAD